MLRRFSYHAFWNFYDYLGTHTLVGVLYCLTLLGTLVLYTLLSLPAYASLPLGLMTWVVFTSVVIAALYPFSAQVARGENPRRHDLLLGLKSHLKQVFLVHLLWCVIAGALIFNLQFYSKVQSEAADAHSHLQTGLIVLRAIVGWMAFAWCLLLPPLLCAQTYRSGEGGLRRGFSRALMIFTLSPLLWIVVLLLVVSVIVVGVYTMFGLIFVMPVMASLGQTAYHLCIQYAGFLTKAREEIGAERSLKDYRKRAFELAEEWEHAQPRRAFKELIRPWEY